MKREAAEALDQCLAWLRVGMDVDSALAHYPELVEDLRPLLELTQYMGQVDTPDPSGAVRNAGQQRMLEALAQKKAGQTRARPRLRLAWSLAAVILVLLLAAIGGGAVAAAADSLPGDALYPVKVTVQEIRLRLTSNAPARQQLQEQFSAQRRHDVRAVLQTGRQVSVRFEGVLHSVEGDTWVVDDLPVTLGATTEVAGDPAIGAWVHVEGSLPGDGSVRAHRLTVEMAALPEPTDTPEPTPTPRPSATEEPTDGHEPVETASPSTTPTSESSETPEPTERPSSTPTPTATRTPEPTETPELIETTEPGDTPEPTEPPEGTETPEPGDTETPPSITPTPERTPRPTETEELETPEPDDTPKPSETPDD